MTRTPQSKIYINARFLTQPLSGVQRYGIEWVRALDDLLEQGATEIAGHRFELLAPRGSLRHALTLKHIPLRRVGRLSGHWWEQLELPFFSRDGGLFCPGNTAPLLSLWSKQAVIVTVHDLSYRYYPGAYSRAFRLWYHLLIPAIFRRATAVITVSTSEQRSILRHYPHAAGRLYAVQNGGLARRFLEMMETIETERNSADPPLLLYVGALNRRKNPQGILQALKHLNKSRRVSLIIAGSSGKSFHDADFGVPESILEQVRFTGQIDDTRELLKLYQRADCFVFPSFYEASPLPPIEAMACGCPVLASDIPSLRERCGDAALYCDPDDPRDIAQKIERLLKTPALNDDLKKKGRERAQTFTWERCVRESLDVFRTVLGVR